MSASSGGKGEHLEHRWTGLEVVVTGPTGDIGVAFLRQLDVAGGDRLDRRHGPQSVDPSEEGLAKADWIGALRVPMLMDTTKARNKPGWEPRFNAMETLAETVLCAREPG